jgi:hypothetical protein
MKSYISTTFQFVRLNIAQLFNNANTISIAGFGLGLYICSFISFIVISLGVIFYNSLKQSNAINLVREFYATSDAIESGLVDIKSINEIDNKTIKLALFKQFIYKKNKDGEDLNKEEVDLILQTKNSNYLQKSLVANLITKDIEVANNILQHLERDRFYQFNKSILLDAKLVTVINTNNNTNRLNILIKDYSDIAQTKEKQLILNQIA